MQTIIEETAAAEHVVRHDRGEIRGRRSAVRHSTAPRPLRPLRALQGDAAGTELADVHEIVSEARSAGARTFPFSPDRAYWKGVEAAAEQVLRPEVDVVEQVAWFDRAHPAFISGFVQTTAMLTPVWSWSGSYARRREERARLHTV